MKNFKMLAAVVETDAEVINPNGETFVDLMVKPGLPLDGDSPVPQVYGLIGPGEVVGEDLTIRIIPQRRAVALVGGGMFPSEQHTSNQTDVVLLGIPPMLLATPQPCFIGISGGFPPQSTGVALRFQKFETPEGVAYDHVRLLTLRWTGANWMAVVQSSGITITNDPDDIASTAET